MSGKGQSVPELGLVLAGGKTFGFIERRIEGRKRSYIQLWPKVLRVTQILISTKFAASVSLDIFVRCYYGILKYN